MQREKRREILEAVGIVAVVASLVFLAWEIRQNTAVISGQSVNELYDAIREIDLIILADGELIRITEHTADTVAELTPVERRQYVHYLALMIEVWERAIARETDGLIDPENVAGWHIYFEDFIRRHLTQEIWQDIRWNWKDPALHRRVDAALAGEPASSNP